MPTELEIAPAKEGMVSFDSMFGDTLSQIKTGDIPLDDTPDNSEEKADAATPAKDNPQPVPAKKEPARAEPAKTAEAKAKPLEGKTEPPKLTPKEEKERRKFAELSEGQREFLNADEFRRSELVKKYNDEITALKAKVEPLEQEAGTLRESTPKLTQEKQRLETDIAELRKEREELMKKVSAYDINDSDEYKANVTTPWEAKIIGGREHAEKNIPGPGINGLVGFQYRNELLKAIYDGDESALDAILKTAESERAKARINTIYDEGRALIDKDREYKAKGPEALKEINDRKARTDHERTEKQKQERNTYFGQVDAAAVQHFPFLAGEEGNDGLNNAIKQAKEKMSGFDFAHLSPSEQAYAAHQYTHAPIIMQVQGQRIGQLTKELSEAKTKHEEELVTKDAELAKLNQRLGNIKGTQINAGSGRARSENGQFSTGEISSAEDMFAASLKKQGVS